MRRSAKRIGDGAVALGKVVLFDQSRAGGNDEMVGVDRPAQPPILNALGQYATGCRNQHQRHQQRSHDLFFPCRCRTDPGKIIWPQASI
jgi:hypothetical protein